MPAGGRGGDPPLACPGCGAMYGGAERFCPECRLPLVHDVAGSLPVVSERHVRARKIKPQLAEGPLVRAITARNLTEAEFIQAMLLEEGIPSMERRSAGFDVPDFLAGGPRDILVPRSGLDAARQVLLQADILTADDGARATGSGRPGAVVPARLAAGLLGGIAVVVVVLWLLFDVVR